MSLKRMIDGRVVNIAGSGGGSSACIATIEATTTASKAYAINDLLLYVDTLYRVTAPIASGGTIVVEGASTNVVATTVEAELKRRDVVVSDIGTASSTTVRRQQITVNNVSYDIKGTAYMEQSVTLSTSIETDVTFTNSLITQNCVIDVGTSVWGLCPTNVDAETTANTCVVTMPKVDSAVTVTVRIYIR